jgi:dTDP-4-dehydrorhamnose 3,5-epimerase
MTFRQSPIAGVVVIEPERHMDDRGFFARTFCASTFAAHGLHATFPQCSVSVNRHAGTLRGMHFQRPPHQEAKLIRCTAGAVFDVAVDIRPGSPTYRRWFGIELTAENRLALYVAEGLAHGFQTLLPDSELFYQISTNFVPASAAGVRWDDPAFGIAWPSVDHRVMSDRDRAYADFVP